MSYTSIIIIIIVFTALIALMLVKPIREYLKKYNSPEEENKRFVILLWKYLEDHPCAPSVTLALHISWKYTIKKDHPELTRMTEWYNRALNKDLSLENCLKQNFVLIT